MMKAAAHKIKKGILMAMVLVVFSFVLQVPHLYADTESPGNPEYIFYKGNTLYEEGKYDEAIREYTGLLEKGLESGSLYYNLGNCYMKKGEHGRAVLNYERAKRLMPRDSDLGANYRFALSEIKYNVSGRADTFYQKIIFLFDELTVNETTAALSAVFIAIILLIAIRLYSIAVRKKFIYIAAVLLTCFLVLAFALYEKVSLIDKEAVVLAESSDARFEPVETATTHFTLHEGMKIYMIQMKKEWAKVRRADGNVGWVKAEDIEKI